MSSELDHEYLIAQASLTLELAHTLRHALAGVRGYVFEARQIAEILDVSSPHIQRLRKALDRANTSAEQALSHLASFRSIAQPRMPALSRTELSELVRDVAGDVAEVARNRSISIRLDLLPVVVVTDRELLHAILFELLRASLRAVTNAGAIVIAMSADQNSVTLEIATSPAMEPFRGSSRGVLEHFVGAAAKHLGGDYSVKYDRPRQELHIRLELAIFEQQM